MLKTINRTIARNIRKANKSHLMPQTPQDWITTILGTVIVICRFIDEGADPFTQPSKLIELIALELLAYFTNHPEVTAAPTGEGEL